MVTEVIIGHYADVLVRRKLAEEISRPESKTKPRRAVASATPAKASTPPADVPLTNKELKARLKTLGVKVPFAANKSTLIALYHEAVKDA